MIVVNVANLEKTYKNGHKALDGLSFKVKEGEIFGLLGPNGSGKTTCINCILALLEYEKGSIEVFEKKMHSTNYTVKKDIGIVPQAIAVYDELTVYENIDFFCGLYINDKKVREKLVNEVIDFVALNEYRNYYPRKLSGGLLRRLNIACGIVHKPKLIILDEPTVAVDPQTRNKILEGIKELNRQGATIIYTSHYMEEVEFLCDRILIMDKGKVIAQGTKEELKELINLGETIEIELKNIDKLNIEEIKKLDRVIDVNLKGNKLIVKSSKGKSNIQNILNILSNNQIEYEKIYSELPTLNDVFLEITGKELRD